MGSPRTLAIDATYSALYLLLDWLSCVEPLHNTRITPWNPNTVTLVTCGAAATAGSLAQSASPPAQASR